MSIKTKKKTIDTPAKGFSPSPTGKKSTAKANPDPKVADLEIKDPNLIFNTVWDELVEDHSKKNLLFPTEIFWLNGAPGAGKGTNTRFIMKYRDITEDPIVVSGLLESEEAKKRQHAGLLAGDREVINLVLRKLLQPQYRNGAIVDGYPRTQVQVECLKLFYEKINQLDSLKGRQRKTHFHIIVLFIDEAESIRRQLHRGQKAVEHNEKVKQSGMGKLIEVRPTDLSVEAAQNRYRTFKELTYNSLQSLKEVFHYHYINAHGTVKEVQERIIEELKYQSSLELDPDTYNRLRKVPLSSQILEHARQHLIARLDEYEAKYTKLFEQVTNLIINKFIPIIKRHAISGRAQINTEDPIFEKKYALAMLIDIFSERGYHATVDLRKEEVPYTVDLKTGKISTRIKNVYRVHFRFQGSEIRRGG